MPMAAGFFSTKAPTTGMARSSRGRPTCRMSTRNGVAPASMSPVFPVIPPPIFSTGKTAATYCLRCPVVISIPRKFSNGRNASTTPKRKNSSCGSIATPLITRLRVAAWPLRKLPPVPSSIKGASAPIPTSGRSTSPRSKRRIQPANSSWISPSARWRAT